MVSILCNQRIRRRSLLRILLRSFLLFKLKRIYNERVQSKSIPWQRIVIVLAVCALISGGYRTVRQLGSSNIEVSLPNDSDIEYVLYQHLLPEVSFDNTVNELSLEVIQKLKIRRHLVRNGETLSELSQRYDLKNLDTIISYNNIKDARSLQVGSVLEIPNRDGLKYTVKRGDNLEKIARKYRVYLNGILDANDLRSAVIQPGQRLFIPEARMSQSELDRVLGELFFFPTQGMITSRFGMRLDPFTKIQRFHNGIDFANRIGTAVLAAKSGKIAAIGTNPTWGKYIIIQHPDGYQTWYAHLNKILVNRNEDVRQGSKIAEMGNTGYSTGPHLHFSIFKNGEPVDPLKELQ